MLEDKILDSRQPRWNVCDLTWTQIQYNVYDIAPSFPLGTTPGISSVILFSPDSSFVG